MYCPKCKQRFEEGSRKACPTDGSRLISDGTGMDMRNARVFSEVVPQNDAVSELDKTLPDIARPSVKKTDTDAIFFELNDSDPDLLSEMEFLGSQGIDSPDSKPIARKVNPLEIPAGHVDLDNSDRAPTFAADFDMDDPEGFVGRTVKGRYRVTEYLDGDENALAYLADDTIVGNKKVLLRILLGAEPDELINSILTEERVSLSHFSHPNIARLMDSGQFTDGTEFLISEYVDALSLRDILNIHGELNNLRAARVIRQAANALNEVHQEGILHRDLRPENLIVDSSYDGGEHTTLVNFGASSGEPWEVNLMYKAPEILDGRIGTMASDIYSLAIMAYEMLVGQLPFDGSSAREIFRSQYAGLARPPSDIRPELPQAVDYVLDKALSFRAKDRYAKARDFGDALYAALTESPQQSAIDGLSEKAEKEKPVPPTPLPLLRLDAQATRPRAPVSPAKITDEPSVFTSPFTRTTRPAKPPAIVNLHTKMIIVIGLIVLLLLLSIGFYYVSYTFQLASGISS